MIRTVDRVPPVRTGNSKLSRKLHDRDASAESGPLHAFRLARRTFLRGEQIDMGALAAELRIDRATLYRWLGNRDALLAEIIFSFAEPAWRRALDEATGTGAARITDVLARWITAVTAADAEFFRAYLRREPARALRLLTTRDGLHQQRVVDLIEQLIADEQRATDLELPLPAPDLAYVITRLAESFVYSDLITGEHPDAAKAAVAIGALLGVEATHRQHIHRKEDDE